MKVQVLSDLHLSSKVDINSAVNSLVSKEAEVVVCCGDLVTYGSLDKAISTFKEVCKSNNQTFLYVLGNHDYYDSSISAVLDKYKDDPSLLEIDKPVSINGYTFIGTTFFTNLLQYPIDTQRLALSYINDFRYIKDANLDVYYDYHTKAIEYFNKYKNIDNVILVTHFPLSFDLIDSKYVGDLLNPYFLNNLNDLLSNFKYCFSGHTHSFKDKDVNGCRCIINPIGYERENTGYTPYYIIDI